MEENEFRRLLELFPVVRSRNYCIPIVMYEAVTPKAAISLGSLTLVADSGESSSHSAQNEVAVWQNAWNEMDKKGELEDIDYKDPFWQKLRSAAEEKVGMEKADKFCKAFQTVHKKLVYEELSLDAAQRFISGAHRS